MGSEAEEMGERLAQGFFRKKIEICIDDNMIPPYTTSASPNSSRIYLPREEALKLLDELTKKLWPNKEN